ncbi:MAG: CBS domain-containing protein [Thermoplasmata archaeon]|nr:MAG: CBS domain-containing protein [Thermoplasmata archaeon]
MKISEIMTKDVIALKPTDSVKKALEVFAEYNIHGVPVVDKDGKLVGMFTETDFLDLVRVHSSSLQMVLPSIPLMGVSFVESEKKDEIRRVINRVLKMPLGDVMSTNVYTLSPNDDVKDAIKLMISKDITRIPIVDNNKLTGIVTRTDIIKLGLSANKSEEKLVL